MSTVTQRLVIEFNKYGHFLCLKASACLAYKTKIANILLFSDSTVYYIITQVILAFWLVLAYDLLEDRRTIDVIVTKF